MKKEEITILKEAVFLRKLKTSTFLQDNYSVIIAQDCLGHNLYTFDLIALGSAKNIYIIVKCFEKYYLHPIDSFNIDYPKEYFFKKIKNNLENEKKEFFEFDFEKIQYPIYRLFLTNGPQ